MSKVKEIAGDKTGDKTSTLLGHPVTIKNMHLLKIAAKYEIGPFDTQKWNVFAVMEIIHLAQPLITVEMMEQEIDNSLGFVEKLMTVFIEAMNIKN